MSPAGKRPRQATSGATAARPEPDDAGLDARAVVELCSRFEAEHLARYGHAFSGEFPVEIVNLRLVGIPSPGRYRGARALRPRLAARARCMHRERVFRACDRVLSDTPVIGRGRLGSEPRSGPLIIEEYEGTCVVPPDCAVASRFGLGNVIIELPAS